MAYDFHPIDEAFVATLNPDADTRASIAALDQIGYPTR
jgi:hypothetical protein